MKKMLLLIVILIANYSYGENPVYIGRITDIIEIEIYGKDIYALVGMIQDIAPSWVNIGADSQGNKLLEPSKAKIEDLISELKKFTEVKNKSNLKRLLK